MQLPTISQYTGTIADPDGLTRSLEVFRVERDIYGEVKIRSGNNACVFRVRCPDGDKMLKCYVKPRGDLAALYDYVSSRRDELLGNVRMLPKELYVFDHFGGGGWYDVVCGDWVEGPTLQTVVERACREGDGKRLEALSGAFDRLACALLGKEWAHGDLKPENIVVREDGSMALIDFDALYYPANPGASGYELGTPGYQHPLRTAGLYDKCLDDYPIALISVSLKALSIDPGLYGRYGSTEIMIMNPADILRGECPAYGRVKKALARADTLGHYRLALLLCSWTCAIPQLAGIIGRITTGGRIPDGSETVFSEGAYYGYRSDGRDPETVVEAVFDEACEFDNGVALVSIDGRRKLYGGGKFLLGDIGYDDIKPVSEGLAAFRREGLWGYASTDGKVVVEPRFDRAGNVHNGLAAVRLGGLWGYIDKTGRPVTPFVFDRALGFRGGTAMAYCDGELLHLDPKGDIIRRCKG